MINDKYGGWNEQKRSLSIAVFDIDMIEDPEDIRHFSISELHSLLDDAEATANDYFAIAEMIQEVIDEKEKPKINIAKKTN